jgi:hypothetical protein
MNKKRQFLAISISVKAHRALKLYCAEQGKQMGREADIAIWAHLEALGIGNPDRSSDAAADVEKFGPEDGFERPEADAGRAGVESVGVRTMPRTQLAGEEPEWGESDGRC